jgi:hypothetical protein
MKPEPKPTNVVCTVCGLDWKAHEQNSTAAKKRTTVTLEDCVRVLKAELARRPKQNPWVGVSGTGWPPAVYGLPHHPKPAH